MAGRDVSTGTAWSESVRTENDKKLHQDYRDEQSVDDNVPNATARFHSGYKDEHELVFVHPRADPEYNCSGHNYQRCERREDHTNSAHKEQVGASQSQRCDKLQTMTDAERTSRWNIGTPEVASIRGCHEVSDRARCAK